MKGHDLKFLRWVTKRCVGIRTYFSRAEISHRLGKSQSHLVFTLEEVGGHEQAVIQGFEEIYAVISKILDSNVRVQSSIRC